MMNACIYDDQNGKEHRIHLRSPQFPTYEAAQAEFKRMEQQLLFGTKPIAMLNKRFYYFPQFKD